VIGQRRHVEDLLGDVFGAQGRGAPVQRIGSRLVALGAHQGELGLGQARRDIGDAHAGALQVAAQVVGELLDEGLARAVDMPARIGPLAGHRADVDDAGALAGLDQRRQQRVGDVDQAGDVGVDHGVPVLQIDLLRGLRRQRQAGVVD